MKYDIDVTHNIIDGESKVSSIILQLRADNNAEREQLRDLAHETHEVHLKAIRDGKAGVGNSIGMSSSTNFGPDLLTFEVHLGGSFLSEARQRIENLLREATRLNDIDV